MKFSDCELNAGGGVAGFFGLAAVGISLVEPLLTSRPFDPWLMGFGVVCLVFSWCVLESVTF